MNESSPNIHWIEDGDLLSAYVLDRVDTEARSALNAHLASCSTCRSVVENELRLAAGVKAFGRNELRKRLRERLGAAERASIPLPRILSAAAVILIIAGVGVYNNWFVITRGLEVQQEEKAIPPAQPIEKPQERDAAKSDRSVEKDESPETIAGKSTAASTRPPSATTPPEAKELRKKEAGQKAEQQSERLADIEMFALEEAGPADTAVPAVAGNWVQGNIYQPDLRSRDEGIQSESMPRTLMAPRGKESQRSATRPQPPPEIPVLLSQQPLQLAPSEHQQELRSDNSVSAVLIPSTDGLLLTLFLAEQLPTEALHSASIRWVGDDSLIVGLPGRVLGFRIPPDILGQQQTLQFPFRQR